MHRFLALLIGISVLAASPGAFAAPGKNKGTKRLLVVSYTAGFHHSVISTSEKVLTKMAADSGFFTVDFCRTKEDVKKMMTLSSLQNYDGVFFSNTTGNLGIPNLYSFLYWLKSGHAFIGVHAATDTYHPGDVRGDTSYIDMIGGEFKTHGQQCEVAAIVDDPSHPAVRHLKTPYKVYDEIYEHKANDRTKVHALLSLDRHPDDGHPEAGQPGDYLLAWCKDYGKGKVFYTALGHRDEVWESDQFKQHILGALKWAFGMEKGKSVPHVFAPEAGR